MTVKSVALLAPCDVVRVGRRGDASCFFVMLVTEVTHGNGVTICHGYFDGDARPKTVGFTTTALVITHP